MFDGLQTTYEGTIGEVLAQAGDLGDRRVRLVVPGDPPAPGAMDLAAYDAYIARVREERKGLPAVPARRFTADDLYPDEG